LKGPPRPRGPPKKKGAQRASKQRGPGGRDPPERAPGGTRGPPWGPRRRGVTPQEKGPRGGGPPQKGKPQTLWHSREPPLKKGAPAEKRERHPHGQEDNTSARR